MSNISIFAKRAFRNVDHGQAFEPSHARTGHLLRVSSMIRADQIVERLGARLNPTTCYHDDVCIYVKPHVKPGEDFKFEGRAYLDIVDGWDLVPLAQANPQVGVIACSDQDGALLRRTLPNPVTVIPQHHCNFDRAIHGGWARNRVGVIGTREAFKHLPAGLEDEIRARGMLLECYSRFFTRQDVVDFYQRIDVQIVWRPYSMHLSNPLKIVNAAAFGVPTIALYESVFDEVRDCYVPVNGLVELLAALELFRSLPGMCADYERQCLVRAERYHIDNVAEMYRSLN